MAAKHPCNRPPNWLCSLASSLCFLLGRGEAGADVAAERFVWDDHGAIIRGDVAVQSLALVFTGDERAEATGAILDTLKQRGLKASFFVTGNFLRQAALAPQLKRMISEGHYLGPHSDSHPLYCAWQDREKILVTQEFFTADLRKNIDDLRDIGALQDQGPIFFIPPYEWHNRRHVDWCRALRVTLVNFTPGSGSNRDYAPEGDPRFVPAETIVREILNYEHQNPHGLNGFILLMHLGSGRKDPVHLHLGSLCDELIKRGYKFERVGELLSVNGHER
jgi:peptidoglycan/xylan/chitin deacetylase (PgdA/CDA1 family)